MSAMSHASSRCSLSRPVLKGRKVALFTEPVIQNEVWFWQDVLEKQNCFFNGDFLVADFCWFFVLVGFILLTAACEFLIYLEQLRRQEEEVFTFSSTLVSLVPKCVHQQQFMLFHLLFYFRHFYWDYLTKAWFSSWIYLDSFIQVHNFIYLRFVDLIEFCSPLDSHSEHFTL